MLDRQSPIPMYHQVKNEIVEMIRQGTFQVGERVYSESEICTRYAVSAITAKRVLNELAKEGYITRHPGKGSFVAQKKPISHVLNHFYSFTNEIKDRGMVPSNRLVRLEKVDPPPECAVFFDIAAGEQVLLVQRHRFADDELIVLDNSFMYGSICPRITREALATASLYEILATEQKSPDKAIETFDAAALSEADAELMGMQPGTAVLKVSRQTFCRGVPVEYNYRYYVPNRYIYRIELHLGS